MIDNPRCLATALTEAPRARLTTNKDAPSRWALTIDDVVKASLKRRHNERLAADLLRECAHVLTGLALPLPVGDKNAIHSLIGRMLHAADAMHRKDRAPLSTNECDKK